MITVENYEEILEELISVFSQTTNVPIRYFTKKGAVIPNHGAQPYRLEDNQRFFYELDYITRHLASQHITVENTQNYHFLVYWVSLDKEGGFFIAGPFLSHDTNDTVKMTNPLELKEQAPLQRIINISKLQKLILILLDYFIHSAVFETDHQEIQHLEIDNYKSGIYHHSYQMEKGFLEYFKEGNPKSFEFLDQIEAHSDMTLGSANELRSFKNKLIMTTTMLCRTSIEGGVDITNAMTTSDHFLQKIEGLHAFQELKHLEKRIYHTFFEKVKTAHASEYSSFVRKIREFILDHLMEPLDLSIVAAQFHRTPSYVSTIFRKECGITLYKFIVQEKIEEAEKFLMYTEDPILDIALRFHFKDQTYFTKVFKKYTGMTPYQFRKKGKQAAE